MFLNQQKLFRVSPGVECAPTDAVFDQEPVVNKLIDGKGHVL
jgi:hypothetical protein